MKTKRNRSTRRTFLASSTAGLAALPTGLAIATGSNLSRAERQERHPVIAISSGNGRRATAKAFEMISAGEDPIDACVAGVNIVEADPKDRSVGYGGLPNEDGVVQLDAAVMHGPTHQAGAVACIEDIKLPSQVALLVLRRTDHVLLVGRGATDFAKAHGFKQENLLTDDARKIWLRWKESLSETDDWLSPPKKSD